MWFKQLQIFDVSKSADLNINNIMEKLELLVFKPCLPSMESSSGWVSPLGYEDEEAPLLRTINGRIMFCLQIEEKVLPASVIRLELAKKIKRIEASENRKVYNREKLTLKDEMTITLLPRAFSRFSKVYAYLNPKTHKLFLGTTNVKQTILFNSMFKKIVGDVSLLELPKLSPLLTHWLKSNEYPSIFSIEKSCIFQDPQQENRVVRCQYQDLFAASIQSLLKEGCFVKQLAINWQDRVSFTLVDDFSFKSLKFQDQLIMQVKEMEPETKEQQFDADFLIMSVELETLMNELFNIFNIEVTTQAA